MGSVAQCLNGHITCQDCSNKLTVNACPTCKDVRGNARCLVAEKMLETLVRFACVHREKGCPAEGLRRSQLREHEEDCSFGKVTREESPRPRRGEVDALLYSRCFNCLLGCPMYVFDMSQHLYEECEYELHPCIHQGCPFSGRNALFRRFLDSHLAACEYRKVRCELCHQSVVKKELENRHLEVCPGLQRHH